MKIGKNFEIDNKPLLVIAAMICYAVMVGVALKLLA